MRKNNFTNIPPVETTVETTVVPPVVPQTPTAVGGVTGEPSVLSVDEAIQQVADLSRSNREFSEAKRDTARKFGCPKNQDLNNEAPNEALKVPLKAPPKGDLKDDGVDENYLSDQAFADDLAGPGFRIGMQGSKTVDWGTDCPTNFFVDGLSPFHDSTGTIPNIMRFDFNDLNRIRNTNIRKIVVEHIAKFVALGIKEFTTKMEINKDLIDSLIAEFRSLPIREMSFADYIDSDGFTLHFIEYFTLFGWNSIDQLNFAFLANPRITVGVLFFCYPYLFRFLLPSFFSIKERTFSHLVKIFRKCLLQISMNVSRIREAYWYNFRTGVLGVVGALTGVVILQHTFRGPNIWNILQGGQFNANLPAGDITIAGPKDGGPQINVNGSAGDVKASAGDGKAPAGDGNTEVGGRNDSILNIIYVNIFIALGIYLRGLYSSFIDVINEMFRNLRNNKPGK